MINKTQKFSAVPPPKFNITMKGTVDEFQVQSNNKLLRSKDRSRAPIVLLPPLVRKGIYTNIEVLIPFVSKRMLERYGYRNASGFVVERYKDTTVVSLYSGLNQQIVGLGVAVRGRLDPMNEIIGFRIAAARALVSMERTPDAVA
jgi:hypothetical protein